MHEGWGGGDCLPQCCRITIAFFSPEAPRSKSNDNTKVFFCITDAELFGFLNKLNYLPSVVLNFCRDGHVGHKETYILLLPMCVGLSSSMCRNIICTRWCIMEPCETSLLEVEASQVYQISNICALGTDRFFQEDATSLSVLHRRLAPTCPSLVWGLALCSSLASCLLQRQGKDLSCS